MYLGSDKDLEDASHLFEVLKDHLDRKSLVGYLTRLKVPHDRVRTYLEEAK
jgi:hypothetical protein